MEFLINYLLGFWLLLDIVENSQYFYVAFATATARIFRAPAVRRARTASAKVAPEVVTSSINMMFLLGVQIPFSGNGFAT